MKLRKERVHMIDLLHRNNSHKEDTVENFRAYKVSGFLAKKLQLLRRKHHTGHAYFTARVSPKKVD